ncbi:MAG: hypothetical protein ACP5UB_03645 [Candidatus Sumerlaeaceae bacterium]
MSHRRGVKFIWSFLAMLVLSSLALGDSLYRTKALAPGHRLALQRTIAQCKADVQAARDPETRSKGLEELCKKLIQAEEYEEALRVAREVTNCEGADPERRAVHHFLIAQIYAMRMEASPTTELMEENRQLALRTAREVMEKHYPKKWLIGDSAAQLVQTLTDPKHLREVRGWVEKRQNDPSYETKLRVAQMQTVQLERAMNLGQGSNRTNFLAPTKYSLVPSQGTAVVQYSRAPEPTKDVARNPNQAVPTQELAKSRQWRGPIVVDGSRVHVLERVPSEPAQLSPYAPGAEPVVSSTASPRGISSSLP